MELEKCIEDIQSQKEKPAALLIYSDISAGFSAGANLRELYQAIAGSDKASKKEELRGFLDRVHKAFNTIDMFDFPTIGVIHGVCFGGGFELALCCDVLIAEKTARFCFPELRLGVIPGFGGIPRLRRDVGNSVIRDLLFTGRSLNAEKAMQIGLVQQVVKENKGLGIAKRLVGQMQKYEKPVTAQAKRFIKFLPKEELELEKEIFIQMFIENDVEASLQKFVESDSLQPYLA